MQEDIQFLLSSIYFQRAGTVSRIQKAAKIENLRPKSDLTRLPKNLNIWAKIDLTDKLQQK